MTDKEKIKAELDEIVEECRGCDYVRFSVVVEHCTNILDSIKEQEAIEPTFKQDKDGIFVWACGSCGAYMYHIYDGIDKAKEYAKYCRQCGRKVRWE